MDVAVDAAGNIYIADTVNSRVRRVSTSGVITTIAGNGEYGFAGMGGPATRAEMRDPTGLALDSFGNLYIADISNDVVWKVDSRGTISVAAGTGSPGFSGDGGAAVNAELMRPVSVAVDADGNLFIADYEFDRIRRVDRQTGIIETVAGNGDYGFSADNVPAAAARLAGPGGLVLDAAGNLYIADSYNNRVRAVRGAR
jgi:sugar lactone lactonase YvrE